MEIGAREDRGTAGWARRPRRLVDTILLYLVFAWFAAVTLVWTVLALAARLVLPAAWRDRIGTPLVMLSARTFLLGMWATGRVHFDLKALDELREAGPLIIAPNHPSLIDAVLIVSRLPDVVCITKAGVFDNVFFGCGMRLAGYVRNDPPLRTVKEARARLRDGKQLLVFPEGTRTMRQPVGPLKPGLALMARQAAVPVQTIFIETSCDFLAKGRPLFVLPPLPLVYRIRLGRRFPPEHDIKALTAELEAYFLAELQP
ncbi:1-acyl-sn-glycerol-3-phosphate acyltransferases [Arboricoccus pini]|uniref:1-acyl-sn-glycerol-3-phosphate acyltransferases n=1 Tax=Arboricoccus pini TaxID=1963835 RepID=A0A212RDB8_9PROT|nr:lysophospholipid acyltransferase family protein [Arboricoccus pini]SNB70211.1 1-acyl-sn-glycerol-3-phosphate acyltransferases [Arboricoccus pini]